MPQKRLYRSYDRQLMGVCGGIAEYFDLDPTLVRLGFVFITFVTAIFPCAIAYFISGFIVPEAPVKP